LGILVNCEDTLFNKKRLSYFIFDGCQMLIEYDGLENLQMNLFCEGMERFVKNFCDGPRQEGNRQQTSFGESCKLVGHRSGSLLV
jgi:hypothetical protein